MTGVAADRPVAKPAAPARGRRLAMVLAGAMALSLWSAWGVDIGFQLLPVGQALLYLLFAWTVVAGRAPRAGRFPFKMYGLICAPVAVLAVLIVLSASYAANPLDSVRYLARYLQGLMLLSAFYLLSLSPSALKRLTGLFALGAVVSAAVAVIATRIPELRDALADPEITGRSKGMFNYANQLGLAMAMAVPLVLSRMSLKRPGWAVGLGLILFAELLSGSKLNLVLVAVNALLYSLLVILSARRYALLAPLAVAGVLGPVVLSGPVLAALKALNPRYHEMVLAFIASPTTNGATVGRQEIWGTVFHQVTGGRYFGIGAGNTDQIVWAVHAHNVEMDIMAGLGLPGLLVFVVLLALLAYALLAGLKKAFLIQRSDAGSSAAIIALEVAVLSYVISNQVSDSFGANTLPLMWMALGLSLALAAPPLRRAPAAKAHSAEPVPWNL